MSVHVFKYLLYRLNLDQFEKEAFLLEAHLDKVLFFMYYWLHCY